MTFEAFQSYIKENVLKEWREGFYRRREKNLFKYSVLHIGE